ncbi:MAG: hypothetical protein ACLRMZ_00450 [Blautia marasmi]
MGFISEEQLLEALSTLLQGTDHRHFHNRGGCGGCTEDPRQLAEKYEMLAVKQAEVY